MSEPAHCKIALDTHEQRLAKLKNVVGLGIVSESDEIHGASKEQAVAVYVEKKVPDKELPASEIVPKFLKIDVGGKKVNVKTRVIVEGRPQKESLSRGESL